MPPNPSPAHLQALSRIPSGLFLVTVNDQGRPLGFVGSFVQQVAFSPPTVCVAVGKDRSHLPAIRSARAFALSVLDPTSECLMGRFFKKHAPGQGPFDGLSLETGAGGSPVVADALAWMDCRLQGEYDAGDHVVLFGEVVDGRVVREGEPSVHLRKSGQSY